MAPLVKMLIASFGSHVSRVCATPVVLGDGCSLSSPRFCSWMCGHRAFVVYGLQVSPRFPATGAPSLCRRILGMMCTSFCGSPQRSSSLCFLRTCSFHLEYCFLWCSLFRLAFWQNSLFVTSTLEHFGLCAPQVSISCRSPVFRDSVDSFEDQVGLGLSPCLMDKNLWEHIQIHLGRDDLLCPRVVARFHATCEWFGPGWTVVLSPLVHVVRRPAWDQSQDLPRFLWSVGA